MEEDPQEGARVALIIDDDPFLRQLVRISLEEIGMVVIEAADAAVGLVAISQHAPDIVLLDVVMPGLSGFEACRDARRLPNMQFCPIVMFTSLEDTESVMRAYECGATDFISKPINWALLQHRVRFILKAAELFGALRKSHLQMAHAQRISSIGSWEWNINRNVVSLSNEMCRLSGVVSVEFGKKYDDLLALVHPSDRLRVDTAIRAAVNHGPTYDLDHLLLLPDATVVSVRATADVVFGSDGKAISMMGTLQDLSQGKLAQQRIDYLANYDVLTDLPNRNQLQHRLNQILIEAASYQGRVTVLWIDLDRFKFINASFGHAIGNILLKEVAIRLRGAIQRSEAIARIRSDEFLLLLPGTVDAQDALHSVRAVMSLFAEPFLVDSLSLCVTASIGLCIYPDHGESAEVLIQNAGVALNEAKEHGPNCFKLYTHEMGLRIEEYTKMEGALQVALDQHQFEIFYQPKVHLRSGKYCGVEALIRWNHPERGLIGPDIFIPLAEKMGLIGRIGAWVLRTACVQAKRWHDMGFDDLSVAVNLSGHQFSHQNVANLVASTLADTGLPPQYLELELTESTLMSDTDNILAALAEIKEIGVTLTLDDFGTGYSSLAYLKRFPIDVIKIDRSFVRNITTDINDASLTKTIILMAKSLNMKTVAEGVETDGQLGFLSSIKCDFVQGFHFSKPVNAAALAELLRKQIGCGVIPRESVPERTILLVDDEPYALSALKRALRNEGYQILHTTSALEAFELLAMHRVQVIISDQRMPVMSGTTFLTKVKEMHPETIRIILSGYTELQSVLDAINCGAVYRFITKPWDDVSLRSQIKEAFTYQALLHENGR